MAKGGEGGGGGGGDNSNLLTLTDSRLLDFFNAFKNSL